MRRRCVVRFSAGDEDGVAHVVFGLVFFSARSALDPPFIVTLFNPPYNDPPHNACRVSVDAFDAFDAFAVLDRGDVCR